MPDAALSRVPAHGYAAAYPLVLPPGCAALIIRRHKYRCLRACLGLALALLAGHAAAEQPAGPGQVLIATEHSAFKDQVVARLADTLRGDGYAVTVIELGQLPGADRQRYQALVLVNTCRAWRPSSEVRAFLKAATPAERGKLVVMTTANSGECNLRTPGVDAISAASKRADPEVVAQQLLDRLRARLAAP
jgi:hypothetical protein